MASVFDYILTKEPTLHPNPALMSEKQDAFSAAGVNFSLIEDVLSKKKKKLQQQ